MKFLVLGGAGYVGSHFVWEAIRQKHTCAVLDDLSRGYSFLIHPRATFVKARVQDEAILAQTIVDFTPDVIVNFAAFTYVDESVRNPLMYFENNVGGTLSILKAIEQCALKVKPAIVFSSTCAVYGQPKHLPIVETSIKCPVSPYGTTKLMSEQIFENFARYGANKIICLRYFNASGADPSGEIGESHDPENHMIPNACKAILQNQSLKIFGSDYATPDGTCLRDYIHVTDLACAHLLASETLMNSKPGYFDSFNVGSGHGTSNLEILQKLELIAKTKINYTFEERRPGDPDQLFSDTTKIKNILGFQPQHSDITTILSSAFTWHSRGK